MKKLIAASAIAVGLLVPVGAAAAAHAAPEPAAPAGSVQTVTDSVQIQAPPEAGQGRMLDIHGKAGNNHLGERVELVRDGQVVQSASAPKIGYDGRIMVSVDAGAQGNHTYEVRLYNNQGSMTAISNAVNVYTR